MLEKNSGTPNTNLDLMLCRKARSIDAARVSQLVNSVYRGEKALSSWTTEASYIGGQRTDESAIREIINHPQHAILVWQVGEELKACVHLTHKNSELAHLGMLTVHIDLQNQKLGRHILETAEHFVRNEWQCRYIDMEVIQIRSELLEWYFRRGYRLTGETSPFPYGQERFGLPQRSDLHFVVLIKELLS